MVLKCIIISQQCLTNGKKSSRRRVNPIPLPFVSHPRLAEKEVEQRQLLGQVQYSLEINHIGNSIWQYQNPPQFRPSLVWIRDFLIIGIAFHASYSVVGDCFAFPPHLF